MWVCLNDGFLSAVQDRFNPDCVLVRARVKDHLRSTFPDRVDKIYQVPGSDYAWRIRIKKETWARFLVDRALDIDYTNFKDSVKDKRLKTMYTEFWWHGLELQDEAEDSGWMRYLRAKYGEKIS